MDNIELENVKKQILDLYKNDNEEIEFLRDACPELFEAMDYSFEAGGKRLRPYLLYETFKFFGGTQKEEFLIKPFMLALEMIHTFSLIHDDLPAIDNDELRRGKESTWKKYGEAVALLAGDALIFRAFGAVNLLQEQIAKFLLDNDTKDKNFFINLNYKIALSKKILIDDAGMHGMVLGETIDTISSEDVVTDEEDLSFMYECKTAALIAAAFKIGGCMANATETELEKLNALGSYVGKAFQIQDDILDVISTDEELGKPVGSDVKNGKITYVTLTSLEEARHEVEHLTHHAIEILDELEKVDSKRDASSLRNTILKLIHRKV